MFSKKPIYWFFLVKRITNESTKKRLIFLNNCVDWVSFWAWCRDRQFNMGIYRRGQLWWSMITWAIGRRAKPKYIGQTNHWRFKFMVIHYWLRCYMLWYPRPEGFVAPFLWYNVFCYGLTLYMEYPRLTFLLIMFRFIKTKILQNYLFKTQRILWWELRGAIQSTFTDRIYYLSLGFMVWLGFYPFWVNLVSLFWALFLQTTLLLVIWPYLLLYATILFFTDFNAWLLALQRRLAVLALVLIHAKIPPLTLLALLLRISIILIRYHYQPVKEKPFYDYWYRYTIRSTMDMYNIYFIGVTHYFPYLTTSHKYRETLLRSPKKKRL